MEPFMSFLGILANNINIYNLEKAIIKAKNKCWIGILFLIYPVLGVLAFALQL